jgi:methionyl-tRNA formyltransferase
MKLETKSTSFTRAICFVGNDLSYGAAALEIVVKSQLELVAVVGSTAEAVTNQFRATSSIETPLCTKISSKRPWEVDEFWSLIDADTLGICCGFDYIIPQSVLIRLPVINAHPSCLPFNRGCHHSFWSIIDGVPFGATIHWVSPELDGGAIIDQVFYLDDNKITAGEAQHKSLGLCLFLLEQCLPTVIGGGAVGAVAKTGGSYHSKKDIQAASTLRGDELISGERLLKLARGTAAKGHGFKVIVDGTSYLISLTAIEAS